MPETYLLPVEAAQALRVSVKTLTQWRWQGKGPPYLRVAGNLIRYAQSELDHWLTTQAVRPSPGTVDDLPPAPTPRAAVLALPPRRKRGSRAPH